MAQPNILESFLNALGGVVQAAAGSAMQTIGEELQQKSAAQNAETETALTISLGTAGQAIGKGFSSEATKYIIIFAVIALLIFLLFIRRR